LNVIPSPVVREEFSFLMAFAKDLNSPALVEVIERSRNRCLQSEIYVREDRPDSTERLEAVKREAVVIRERLVSPR
jgi:hypothetical protein